MTDYYQRLGIRPDCTFDELKRAYYQKAKATHPDHFGGDSAKSEAFKAVLEAFDVLSDPLKRAAYDQRRAAFTFADDTPSPSPAYWQEEAAILDTHADDILEELIVGNTIPRNTTLQTLMLDIERTERFCLFREGKTRFYTGHTVAARAIFEQYLVFAPLNILAHYYRGRCLIRQHHYRAAARAYHEAIRIGARRRPPLHLPRIRRELQALRRYRLGWTTRLRLWWFGDHATDFALPPDEAMRQEVSRAMHNLIRDEQRRVRKQLKAHNS